MRLLVHQGVSYRKVGNDFLAYSALTSETVVLTQFAYQILIRLAPKSLNFTELLDKLKLEGGGSDDFELSLRDTLNELSKRGFILTQSDELKSNFS